jgi:hypothetical protein
MSLALGLLLLSGTGFAHDLNGDGVVDRKDLDVMIGSFYTHDARADLDGDGNVNFRDLAILKHAMGGSAEAMAPAVAPNISLLPAAQGAGKNSSLTLDLWMDFSQEATLGGGVDTFFDPDRLRFLSFTFDPALGDDPAFRREPDMEAPGVLSSLAFGSFTGLSGPARVGTFTFATRGLAGSSALTMAADVDGVGGPFVSAVTLQVMTVVFNPASVKIGSSISLIPGAIEFGNVRLGQFEQNTLTVKNIGTASVTIGRIGSTDPIAPPFSISSNDCNNRTLAPTATCTVNVRLGGTSQGLKTDRFNIPSNAPDTPNILASVSGLIVPKVGVTSIAGITTTTATCTNENTGQSVNIQLAGATSLNCETSGLSPVAPGASVSVTINGTRSSGNVVGATVRSMGLNIVQCQDLTNGQNRNFDPDPPGPDPRNWNCRNGNWIPQSGDQIRMTVRGPAD